jgi:FkbM family methyltransferase
MVKLIKLLYGILPKFVVNYLGKLSFLKKIRDRFLRPNNTEAIISEKITWGKGEFVFYAPIRMAVKAKERGIESKLLRNSLTLLKQRQIERLVMLDIGANYGFISLALQTNSNEHTKIVSFEPHPEIANALVQSIQSNNFKNIKVENAAIGNEDCDIELNLYGQTSNILKSNEVSKGKVTIKQIKLDNYLLANNIQPNFIKIDVDGYELNVLKGLSKTIEQYKPIMVIETNDDKEVLNFVAAMGYQILDLDLQEFEGIPGNIFCLP